MSRICEVCGRIEDILEEDHKYDILDVCPQCTEHVVHPLSDISE
ncbi:hypothetical protein [Sediminibacillus massiliensis]|nr:hypothetical protein [Sediminibacillus massiliensis]